ncbi:MAG: hypothetical protein KKE55_05765 [Candidatus Omnitrophica bacterium]|nr:hypothetical protein [Candidatus Omnitrophota bacterium]MBU1524151.1 hypothetical protein [Candidatus Omnitrophota bacterium]MBU2437183.1 hypothetical protein [Candidatus Omnitrophota bacterium]MBU2504466.1 hypothetical protein [Candidatus Omnitrophota bacterium]
MFTERHYITGLRKAESMLVLAIFPWPYGYYTILRLFVCLTAALLAWISYKRQMSQWVWIMVFTAVVFNPVVAVHFGRELWIAIDLITAIVFGVYLKKHKTLIISDKEEA